MNLKVNEIFWSVQAEGANTGMPAIFIRLAGCNLKCDFCDTEYQTYIEMSIEEIQEEISQYPCKTIIWTGGEPLLQLTTEILFQFTKYINILETNGTKIIPNIFNYITCSPKVTVGRLLESLNRVNIIGEFRYTFPGDIPEFSLVKGLAFNFYISPILSDGLKVHDRRKNKENINGAIEYVKTHPDWKLSIQIHKLVGFK
jgi:organic radical activating enzyme